MKKNNIVLFALLALSFQCTVKDRRNQLIKYADPIIGTAKATTASALKHSIGGSELRGQTFPAVGVPHGMTQWTPQTQASETKCLPSYYYEKDSIQGFRASHWMSGSCTKDYGSVTLMPTSGKYARNPAKRASHFDHGKETSTPAYYAVQLDDYGILAEMTAMSHSGMLQFTFDHQGETRYIIVEANSDSNEGYVKVNLKDNEIIGYNPVRRIYQGWGESAGFKGYFVIKFSNPIKKIETNNNHSDHNQIVTVSFEPLDKITVQTGLSFTSIEDARKNLLAEIGNYGFTQVRKEAEKQWNAVLGKIQISGGSDDDKIKFYTALYHANLLPRIFSDVDGKYVGFAEDSTIHVAKNFHYYADFSMWDTYRALDPLLCITEPKAVGDMVQSLLMKAKQGGWLPIFPAWNNYTSAMIGDHAIAMICDAYARDIRDFDVDLAWKMMYKNAFVYNIDSASYKSGKGRRALDTYLKYHYLPLEEKVPDSFHKEEQVSRTLEYAFDDFTLGQFAKSLGKDSAYQILMQRAKNWTNVFDTTTGYVRGRYVNGSWIEPFEPNATRARFITEGSPFQYTWYVPQDVYGLMNKMGGKSRFIQRLDTLFNQGYYWHGNEPGHQIVYLYPYAGEAWKTQQWVKTIIDEEYDTGPGGLSGNEDAGQMSAWLVLSMMGFYPVCPGTPYYIIGAPAFDEITINLPDDRQFRIEAKDRSKGNIYIQSAMLNGVPFNRAWLKHDEIMKGGELVFEMGPEPNKSWASDKESLPPDLMR